MKRDQEDRTFSKKTGALISGHSVMENRRLLTGPAYSLIDRESTLKVQVWMLTHLPHASGKQGEHAAHTPIFFF